MDAQHNDESRNDGFEFYSETNGSDSKTYWRINENVLRDGLVLAAAVTAAALGNRELRDRLLNALPALRAAGNRLLGAA